jgi:hypothetical protein
VPTPAAVPVRWLFLDDLLLRNLSLFFIIIALQRVRNWLLPSRDWSVFAVFLNLTPFVCYVYICIYVCIRCSLQACVDTCGQSMTASASNSAETDKDDQTRVLKRQDGAQDAVSTSSETAPPEACSQDTTKCEKIVVVSECAPRDVGE